MSIDGVRCYYGVTDLYKNHMGRLFTSKRTDSILGDLPRDVRKGVSEMILRF